MDSVSLSLDLREVTGKQVKRLRKDGFVPAVIHDHGKASVVVQGEYQAVHEAYKTAGKHHPVQLSANGKKYVERAEHFYERFGSKTMLLAHFVPIVRTFAPIVAGVAHMNRLQFFVFDAIGDIAWAVVVTMLGYWFGSRIPNIDHYILPAVGAAMLITFGPMVWHLATDKEFHVKLRARLAKKKTNPTEEE